MAEVGIKITVQADASLDGLKELAEDIASLTELIPEWHAMEVTEIHERIYNRFLKMLKLHNSRT